MGNELNKPLDGMKIPNNPARGRPSGGGGGGSKRPFDPNEAPMLLSQLQGDKMNGMMPPGGGGGDLAAQLMQLIQSPAAQQIMSSPKGQQMAQAIMSQMGGGGGGDPRAMMAQMGAPQGGGGFQGNPAANPGGNFDPTMPDGGDMAYAEMDDALMQADGGVQRRPPQDNYATGEVGPRSDPRQTPMPSTEDEMAMVQQQMGGGTPQGGGGGGMNSDGPTPEEIQLLQSSPSPRNVANFEKLFGPGSAQQYLGGGGGTTYEQDVKGAMQQYGGGNKDYDSDDVDAELDKENY